MVFLSHFFPQSLIKKFYFLGKMQHTKFLFPFSTVKKKNIRVYAPIIAKCYRKGSCIKCVFSPTGVNMAGKASFAMNASSTQDANTAPATSPGSVTVRKTGVA